MSQNRDHLVPTTITNKNGVRTTVHKKPAAAPASVTKLPKATLRSSRKDREHLEKETAAALVHQDFGLPATEIEATNRAKNYQQLLAILPQYSNETLHRFTEAALTDIGWKLNDLLIEATPNEGYINDWLTIEPIAQHLTINSEHVVNGLEKYNHLTPQEKGHYPLRRTQQVIAITRVTDHLGTLGEGLAFDVNKDQALMQVIEDEKLRDLLTTHENPDALSDIITNRDITDAKQISELYGAISNTANPLSDGTL